VKTHVKKYPRVEMLPLETKRSGGKLLPQSDLRGGVFLEEVSRNRKRDIVLDTWNVRSLYRAGSLTGKRLLGRPRRRREDNIKMDLQEVGVVGTGWRWLRIGTGGGRLWVR
jgi:hypothetical protein